MSKKSQTSSMEEIPDTYVPQIQKVKAEKARYKPANVKIGLVNRSNYDLTVQFISNKETDTVILPPSFRSPKEFIENKIQSVNGLPFREAERKGLVSIIR